MAESQNKFPDQKAYLAALQANGLSEAEAREMVRVDLVVGRFLDREVIGKISLPEAEIRKFYEENLPKFSEPAKVHLSHILIGVDPEASPEARESAKKRAAAVRRKLLDGTDFAALALSESSCPSKEAGGDLGSFDKDEMLPEFEKALVGLKPGGISLVVQSKFGYHVLKLLGRSEAAVTDFQAAREKIDYYLRQQKTQQAITEYVAALKETAKIERITGR